MNQTSELEDFVHFFKIRYYEGGRDKEELIRFIKRYPNASALLSAEIIEQLENPSKRFLDGKRNMAKERFDEAIYEAFIFGPNYLPEFNPDGSLVTNTVWGEKSYDDKCYELSKLFPQYTLSTLKKNLSYYKKQQLT
jgi:hypothetical protein